MKTLLIMRHAKSAYPPGISDDFDRPLNKRGRADLPRIAHLLAAYGPRPEVVLASAARRARQTATGLVEALGLPASALHLEDALYLSSPSTLTQAATGLPDSAQTSLIIAHNPGLEEWIGALTGAHIALPTAGLAAVELGIHAWAEISRGRLLYFVVPRLVKAITQ
ncbi:MAG: histidine phosphatase family protein [Candidatus Latescibacteria bacterium]|nr:histidine phosphatase family protein [Candidatus Latescibacterota bacterium]